MSIRMITTKAHDYDHKRRAIGDEYDADPKFVPALEIAQVSRRERPLPLQRPKKTLQHASIDDKSKSTAANDEGRYNRRDLRAKDKD